MADKKKDEPAVQPDTVSTEARPAAADDQSNIDVSPDRGDERARMQDPDAKGNDIKVTGGGTLDSHRPEDVAPNNYPVNPKADGERPDGGSFDIMGVGGAQTDGAADESSARIQELLDRQRKLELALDAIQKQGFVFQTEQANAPLKEPTDPETRKTMHYLREFPKKKVFLPQNPPGQPQLPPETVTINGYVYQIQRGKSIEVPAPVREVLLNSALVYPDDEEEAKLFPTVAPDVALRMSRAGSSELTG